MSVPPKRSAIGTLQPARSNGHVFTDARSNDLLLSVPTLQQQFRIGFGSNGTSSFVLNTSNLQLGTTSSNVHLQVQGPATVTQNMETLQAVTASNAYVRSRLGVGTLSPNAAYNLHVNGAARIEGDLVVNGTMTNVNTNVSVTDQFHITNDGTGPALQVNQTGVQPIAVFQDDGSNVFQIVDTGAVAIGPAAPLAKLDVQGDALFRDGLSTTDITASNITTSNLTVQHNLDAHSLNITSKLAIDAGGIQTPSLQPLIQLNTNQFTLNGSNVTLGGSNVSITVAQSLNIAGNAAVQQGNLRILGSNDYAAPGDQGRLYFGPAPAQSTFIGGACNVGIVLQVPGTTYPFVLEEGTGYLGLGTMDPEERLHVLGHAKVGSNAYVGQRLTVGRGHSNAPTTLSVYGDVGLSNATGTVILAAASNQLGINTATPQATLHVRRPAADPASSHLFLADNGTTGIVVTNAGKLGIGTVTPSYQLDVTTDARVKNKLWLNSGTQIPWTLEQATNDLLIQSQSAASNALRLTDTGHLEWSGRLALGTSNPTEMVDIRDNAIVRSNAYVMTHLGVGTSNPGSAYAVDIVGDLRLQGALIAAGGYPGAWQAASNTGNMSYEAGTVSVGGQDYSEVFTVSAGNAKFGSNAYVMGRLGVGTSNPTEALDVTGYAKASEGVLGGPALMRAWPADTTYAAWVHIDLEGDNSSYALTQTPDGTTALNAAPGQSLNFQISNVTRATLTPDGTFAITALAVGHSNTPAQPLHVVGNTATTGRLAVGHTAPEEALHVVGAAKVSTSTYIGQRLAIAHSNPTEAADIHGHAKISSNVYVMQALSVGHSNPQEALDVAKNIQAQSNVYALQRIAAGHSNPEEILHVAGNAKVTNNVYALARLAIAHSNPQEALHVVGAAKISSHVYALGKLAVGHSNPTETVDIQGNLKVTGAILTAGATNVTAGSNLFVIQNLGIGTSNPKEALDVTLNAKIGSNVYAMQRLAIGSSNPTETLHVQGSAKAILDVYAMRSLGVGTSNPTEAADIQGNLKLSGAAYALQRLGVATSNPTEVAHIEGNLKVAGDTYALQRLAIAHSNPTEALHIAGNAKATQNIYAMQRLAAGHSNPTEALHVVGNTKVTQNMYVMTSMGIATSNPAYHLDVNGNINFLGKLYNNNQEYPMSRWSSNNTASNIWYTGGRVAIGTSTHTELLTVQGGNIKGSSNIYAMERLGVGTSNPTRAALEVTSGSILATNGTQGPMIMLIPPIAYADVSVGGTLVLDNTLEAGNEVSSATYRSLFYGNGFLTQDASTDQMQWNEARFIFRGMALSSNNPENTTMCVQDYHYGRTPPYQAISSNFIIQTPHIDRGYTTNATPWFTCSTADVRHLAIQVVNSTDPGVYYRFGSVYMQFR